MPRRCQRAEPRAGRLARIARRSGLQGGSPADGLPLAALGLALLVAVGLGEVAAGLGVPRLTGYLAAGLIVGQGGLGILESETISSIGLIQDMGLALLALQAEAAALLGTTEKAIETRIYRARNRLRERVKNFEGYS